MNTTRIHNLVFPFFLNEDTGQQFTISPPANVKVTDVTDANVMKSFITTSAIDWDKSFEFVGIDRSISHMIANISTDIVGNVTEIVPCNYYYLEPEEAKNINLR